MKIFFSIILLMSFTTHTEFKKRVLPYGIVISKADLIVEGEISSVLGSEYQLKVTEIIKGNAPEIIDVEIWKEWACDKRIKKVQNNQRLLLFLKEDKGVYKIINGSTGELFILEDNCVETFMKPDFPKVDELKKGIKLFINSMEFKGNLYPDFKENNYFKRLISQEKINEMVKENDFMDYILSEIKHYEIR